LATKLSFATFGLHCKQKSIGIKKHIICKTSSIIKISEAHPKSHSGPAIF